MLERLRRTKVMLPSMNIYKVKIILQSVRFLPSERDCWRYLCVAFYQEEHLRNMWLTEAFHAGFGQVHIVDLCRQTNHNA